MRIYLAGLPLLFLAACGGGAKKTADNVEIAVKERAPAGGALESKSNSTVTGMVEARPAGDGVELKIRVAGATAGKHGVHLHETGDCSSPDAKSAGGHWNPDSGQHGAPGASSHGGDLGNMDVAADGTGTLTITLPRKLDTVVGKAVVVHAGEDDLKTQPAGNSGDRVACGVIVAAP